MGFSPLANMSRRIQPGGRQSRRNSRIRGFTIHHQAGVNAHGEASNPRREVSANYWITNEGVIIPNIDETMRAWTTGASGYPAGAASDHRNITVEVSNSPAGVRSGSWALSSAARKALTNLIGDVFRRHKLGTVRRGTGSGVAVHRDFVPTSCPGPYIMKNLSSIISQAERARKGGSSGGGSTAKKGTKVMKHYQRRDLNAGRRSTGRTIKPGAGLYLNEKNNVASQATNIVGGIGYYDIKPHVYAEGTPGDKVIVRLLWSDTRKKPATRSWHYAQELTIGPDGKLKDNRAFARHVSRGYAVYLHISAPKNNKGNVKVTLAATDSYLFN